MGPDVSTAGLVAWTGCASGLLTTGLVGAVAAGFVGFAFGFLVSDRLLFLDVAGLELEVLEVFGFFGASFGLAVSTIAAAASSVASFGLSGSLAATGSTAFCSMGFSTATGVLSCCTGSRFASLHQEETDDGSN